MTTLCIDVPYNYVATGVSPYGEIRFAKNDTLKLVNRSKIRLPNDLLGKKLRLRNYRYQITPAGDHDDPSTLFGYFNITLSCGGRTASNSYLVSHKYGELANYECTTEDVIALPFFATQNDMSASYATIHLPGVSNIEMNIDVTAPEYDVEVDNTTDPTNFAFSYLTLWFEVL